MKFAIKLLLKIPPLEKVSEFSAAKIWYYSAAYLYDAASPQPLHPGNDNVIQESCAVAREPRDAVAIVFGIKFADNIH